jgi:cytochrome c oxidase cbb3-type subunit 2
VSLKQNTWGTEGQILMNSIIHLIFAILAVYSLKKTSALTTLLISFVCLLFGASLLILEIDHRIWVSIPYTAGVSFYSVALVCVAVRCLTLYSAFFVALLYAISGWIGSAMGIGMVQDLNKIPPSFVGITAVLFIPIVFWNLTQQKKV